ncbi:hypothetical protein ACRARG_04435 [Pseudooceanicola sp. C21-150M6]|uniref:hypothetical protein n=1 Tax=Pseudooceanicola sp. C21-150M6 TaxID=3434355 RepID=UPI003D7F8FF0
MKGPYYDALRAEIRKLGGYHNAHTHLDRANTLADGYVEHGALRVLEASHISLQQKHKLIATVHDGPAYDPADLERRVRETLDVMVGCGTARVDSMVDVTPDRVGTSALTLLRSIAEAYSGQIDMRLAAYTPFGFRDDMPRQWAIFEEGVALADFIGSLPEADDTRDYPGHIGFDEHCRRMHDLARRSGKMLHVHTDQLNIPEEDGTERLIEVVRQEGVLAAGQEPQIWAVHAISPSTYDDRRWQRYVEGLLETNIGVICCPSAAIGMRQMRSRPGPTYNSIVRVLELAEAGVPVRLGSDNIADMCSPSTTADLGDEVFMLSAAIRYYKVEILAKLAVGQVLTAEERAVVSEHLRLNDAEIVKRLDRWSSPANRGAARAPVRSTV